ncbi:NAD-dependent epimerase/dehydratase family protein [Anaerocolumna xylanovorans]|uniref:Nucleoside-diphosphate-sugar epimerase n=1 Tax=Anaerocolumna xylanovorans DSM 12503 TaxID=1121345 RepID=A0A1M7Y1P2_9FIRM|nr:NAD-dependent epimerase/dehydratase family protein [Anaerocolumna xylanovorans]SHO45677.1 Nucleoside-diphosphate-sugar epimerase [Anaerocolumna xylanovorans DSM 12503]
MNILVTGAGGFLGRHMTAALKDMEGITVYESFHQTKKEEVDSYLASCDFIYHLAGVNRSDNITDFTEGNVRLTEEIRNGLVRFHNPCPILYASSIHAIVPSPYGKSKKAAEEVLRAYERNLKSKVYIYRLTNLFGSGAKPNYNSVVATFCYNIVRGLPIVIHDRNTILNLCCIEDVIKEFCRILKEEGFKGEDGYYGIPKVYQASLGMIADTLYAFHKNEGRFEELPEFERALYRTFLSYKEEWVKERRIYEDSANQ